jgi:DNA-binding NarL/FixJ family response regulator
MHGSNQPSGRRAAPTAASDARADRVATVLICDDVRQVREGLRRSVARLPAVSRVELVGSGEELLAKFPQIRPDLVLLDIGMPGVSGLETVRRLLRAHPGARVVLLTVPADREFVGQGIVRGACGYVAKSASGAELSAAVATVLGAVPQQRVPSDGQRVLTEREVQVLRAMSEGKSNGQIGRELYLSEDTIKTHARRLFRKLGAADRAQAVAVGFRLGLVH